MVLVSICITASGCFPFRYTMRPGVAGTVVGADNQKPIGGADVLFGLSTTNFTQTDTDGSFLIPPQKKWGIWIIPQDVFHRSYSVTILHAGYEPYNSRGSFSPADQGKNALKQLGVISLKPLP